MPVGGLAATDFQVQDNGVTQAISAVSTENVPLDVSLLMDTSGSAQDAMSRVKKDVQAITNMLRPVDRARLVVFDREVHELFPMQPPADPLPLRTITASGGTSLNDAVAFALMQPPAPDRRQMAVVFTDGEDSTSVLDEETLVKVAKRSDAVLNAVLFKPATARGAGYFLQPPPSLIALSKAAEQSGGDTRKLNDAVAAFRTILDDYRNSYVLQYSALGVKREGWHDVSVIVTRPGGSRFSIRARRGYFGG